MDYYDSQSLLKKTHQPLQDRFLLKREINAVTQINLDNLFLYQMSKLM